MFFHNLVVSVILIGRYHATGVVGLYAKSFGSMHASPKATAAIPNAGLSAIASI
jgi:hypothetical protein